MEAYLSARAVNALVHENGRVIKKREVFATAGPYLQKTPMYPHMNPRVERQGIVM
jgi:hypothetical protein